LVSVLLRYKKQVGVFLEKKLAYAINCSEFFNQIDVILAVPLNPKKTIEKSIYNQSNFIANGIKEILPVEIDNYVLNRIKDTDIPNKKKAF